MDLYRQGVRRGTAIAPTGRCHTCARTFIVAPREWSHASRPRCQACGDFLAPGTHAKLTATAVSGARLGVSGRAGNGRASEVADEAKNRRALCDTSGRRASLAGQHKTMHACPITGCQSLVSPKHHVCVDHHKLLPRPLSKSLWRLWMSLRRDSWKHPKRLRDYNLRLAHAKRLIAKAATPLTSG